MKMKVIDRILLALYAVLGVALIALCVLLAVAPNLVMATYVSWAAVVRGSILLQTALILLALLLLAWSVRLIVLAFNHQPRYDKNSVSIQNTENGAVRISVAAMDTLVKQAIGHTEGVQDIKTRIINHEDSITVKIDMTLSVDVHIPNITMLMQRNIKNFIEEFSGIAVREVEVMVSALAASEPALPVPVEKKSAVVVEMETSSPVPSPAEEPATVAWREDAPESEPETPAEPEPGETESEGDDPVLAPDAPEETSETADETVKTHEDSKEEL